jgi:HAD superfamily hydrolase (TIGR01490 family)
MRNWTEEQALAAFDWIIHDYIMPTARPDVMARFSEHQAQGHSVVLVSGMPLPCLERLGEALGTTGVIGTGLEVQDGRYTGASILPVMVGAHKATGTRAFFAARGIDVDWAKSFAYGDSIHDQSIFDLVGHPVAVYPDAELRALAEQKGWDVMGG